MTTNCKLLSSWHYINVRSDIEYETQSSRAQESWTKKVKKCSTFMSYQSDFNYGYTQN